MHACSMRIANGKINEMESVEENGYIFLCADFSVDSSGKKEQARARDIIEEGDSYEMQRRK